PFVGSGMGRVEGKFDVLCTRARSLGEWLAGDRCDHIEVLALHRWYELAVDEIVVGGLEVNLGARGPGVCVKHGLLSPSGRWNGATAIRTPRGPSFTPPLSKDDEAPRTL